MEHLAAFVASLASLGLICALYYINILSRSDSWLRADMIAMICLAVLTGLYPIAFFGSLVGVWQSVTDGLSLSAVLSAGLDLAGFAAAMATILVLRALVKATYRSLRDPNNVTPLTPRPVTTGAAYRPMKKAA